MVCFLIVLFLLTLKYNNVTIADDIYLVFSLLTSEIFMNTFDDTEKTNKKKRELYIPTFTIILMLLFGVPGLFALYSYRSTLRDCSSEVTGIIDDEYNNNGGDKKYSVEGKYLNSDGHQHVSIIVNTDDKFLHKYLYASKSFGNVGDKVVIHYNPDNPDEYYIDDYIYAFDVAMVLLVIGGAMLVLSIFLMIYYTIKGEPDEKTNSEETASEEEDSEEQYEKELKKEKEELERKQKSQERLDRYSGKAAKNYTNEHIRRQIQNSSFSSRIMIWMLFIGGVLVLSSIIRTYIDIHTDNAIPFNNYSDKFDDTCYSVIITEKPQEISLEQGNYYDLAVGNDHIPAKHLKMNTLKGMDGPVKLRGKLKRIGVSEEKTREVVKEYYQKIGYYDTLKDEEYAYYYLDCSKISLWDEIKNNHISGFVFGLTIIIVAMIFSHDCRYMLKNIRPACSGRRYRAGEIDKLANDIDTVWLKNIEVLVTPSSLIGLNHGLTVIDYRDISAVKAEEINHRDKYRKWNTYRIYIITKTNKKMLLTECETKNGYRSLTQNLDKRYVEYELL